MVGAQKGLIIGILTIILLGSISYIELSAEEDILNQETNLVADRILSTYGQLPIYFEANEGQVNDQVRYMARTSGYTLFLTENQAVFSLEMEEANASFDAVAHAAGRYGLQLNFEGANPHPSLVGESLQEGISSYFIGSREEWHTSIAHYGKVRYQQLYDGIDAIFYGNPQQLQYDFEIAPYADPSQIQLAFDPVENLTLTEEGSLLLDIGSQTLTMRAPYSYQMVDGVETVVESRFAISGETVHFVLGQYDESLSLTIDPVLIYASFVGGTANDIAYGVDVDSSGNAYIVGMTTSNEANFPVTVGPDLTWNGNFGGDAFIKKLNAAGTAIIYAGYIGGSGGDIGYAVAVDASGNAYVTGHTGSSEATFPVTGGPVLTHPGGNTAFVAKVNASGASLDYAGYIATTNGRAIAVDASGNAYVTGSIGGSIGVHKVNAAGTGFVYQYNVGSGTGRGIAVDASGSAYVTGQIGTNAVVAKVNAAGNATDYLTTLGGSSTDNGLGIAVDSSGNAYVAGETQSTNFPTVGSLDTTYGGGTRDGFVAKLDASGNTVYSAFLGGSSFDAASGVVVDSNGNAYVTGQTSSTQATFPVVGGPDLTKNGASGGDAFITMINASGTAYVYSGYIGGAGNEYGYTIAMDSLRNVYIVGISASNDGTFPDGDGPGSIPGYSPSYIGGLNDGFIAKVSYPILVEFSATTASSVEGNSGTSAVSSPTLLVSGGNLASAITLEILLTDGTATLADSDYSQTSATVTIPAADYTTVQSISIPVAALGIVGDTTDEPDEDFTLGIQNIGTGVVIGDANNDLTTISTTTYTILNDDSVSFNVEFSAATASGLEGDSGTSSVTAPTLLVSGGVLASPATVDLALTDGTATLADSDYSQTSATITIPAADYTTVQSVSIPVTALSITGDTTDELDETLSLALQNPSTGFAIGDADSDTATTSTATYTIFNDDSLTFNVEFSAATASGLEGDSGSSAVTGPTLLVSGGVLASPATVDLTLTDGTATLADSDYAQTAASITIPAGDYTTVQSVAIPAAALSIVGDADVEADESLSLALQNPSTGLSIGDANSDTATTSTATYTILNDDGVTFSVEFSAATASGLEGDSGTSAIVSPTLLVSGGVIASPATVDLILTDGTATLADNDYIQTTATITIPAGDYTTVQSVAIPAAALSIVGDTNAEFDETLTLALQNASAGFGIGDADGDMTVISTAVYTITSDDEEPAETASGGASIDVFDPAISKLGFLVPGQTGVSGEQLEWIVTVSNNGGTAGTNIVVTDTVNADLRINSVEVPEGVTSDIEGQVVTVTIPALNPGQSINFSIFTTTLQGASVSNTACLMADNYGTSLCSTGSSVNQLPSTGESPWSGWRLPLMSFFSVMGVVVMLVWGVMNRS
ncbi:SBBP repeat-containing protein [Phototrophicus methaneseepsis]|uniref:SBBP repeat-containing protein n=1 Tax=Phototrophicus methaneseepsis TaxID=2710758 RepID=A0A7S8E6M8_9CHLR|nr:SBBP repeat-containing protein [Phototrophicus methaneseepsis]QPC81339.1 SBBP repeat-containing protein [Phototrophicus methaneseepsis]